MLARRWPGADEVGFWALGRIDDPLATPGIAAKAKADSIDLAQRFSDHAPLVIDHDFTL